jgi:hypothetical protein
VVTITEAAPIVVAPAPKVEAAPLDLTASLESAGLVMVQTSSTSKSLPPIVEEAPRLGRKPKAPVVIANEPLQMVETRNN